MQAILPIPLYTLLRRIPNVRISAQRATLLKAVRFNGCTTSLPTASHPIFTPPTQPPPNKTHPLPETRTTSYSHVTFESPPRTILVIKKPGTTVLKPFLEFITYISQTYPLCNIVLETCDHDIPKLPNIYTVRTETEYERVVDVVFTLGGDGTILHASSLFKTRVPPFISFSLGSLGFLVPFCTSIANPAFNAYKQTLEQVFSSNVSLPVLQRMRLSCGVVGRKTSMDLTYVGMQVMNDVTVHRGAYAQLSIVECFVNGVYLTDAVV